MKSPKGQLSIGLAFVFTAVLAFFGLVFNSSMITRDKMKLQQTTDFAALVAADVQRRNLNAIRKLNQDIEIAYQATIILLQPNYCLINGLAAPRISTESISSINGITGGAAGTCDQACDDYDSWVRKKIIQAVYDFPRNQLASHAIKIVTEANQKANEKVLETFLTPKNIPFSFRKSLEEKWGNQLSLSTMLSAYSNGQFEDQFTIVESYKEYPLFLPKEEPRMFLALDHNYFEGACPNPITGLHPCCLYGGVSFIPKIYPTVAKIVRDGDYTTSYLAAAEYSPVKTQVDKTFALYLQNPDPNMRASSKTPVEDLRGKKIKLFGNKTAIAAMAFAKPYGGTFPVGGNILNPLDFGDIGKEFEGSKLIGIADKDAVGGIPPFRDFTAKKKDESGLIVGDMKIFVEDFLH